MYCPGVEDWYNFITIAQSETLYFVPSKSSSLTSLLFQYTILLFVLFHTFFLFYFYFL